MVIYNNSNLVTDAMRLMDTTKTHKGNHPILTALFFSMIFHAVSGMLLLKMIGSMAPLRVVVPIEITVVTPTAPEPPPPQLAPTLKTRPLPAIPRTPPARLVDQSRPQQETKKTEPSPLPVLAAQASSPSATITQSAPQAVSAPTTARPSLPVVQSTPPSRSIAAQGPAGPVVGPSYDAGYLNNPTPPYPATARRLKLQGAVVVRVLVSTEGNPQNVALEKSSGTRILDDAALEAVKGWRFVPARRGTERITAWVDVPIRFHLN